MDKFYLVFLYFFIYSVLGWLVETIYCRIGDGKWTNRGFLFGPYCPIYGYGSLIIIYMLEPFVANPLEVFLLAIIFTSTLEYVTSFLLEKIFNAKWWDYSQMKFNLNGRVCLFNSVAFGILGIILTYFVHPFISSLVEQIPSVAIQYISSIIFVIICIDTCSTIMSLLNIKEKLALLNDFAENLKEKNAQKLSDMYIYKELSEIRKNILVKKNMQLKRLIEAFPSLEFNKFKTQFNELKLDFHKLKNELKEQKKLKKQDKKVKELKEKN